MGHRPLRRTAVASAALFAALYVVFACTLPGQTFDYWLWEFTLRVPTRVQADLDGFSRLVMPVIALAILLVDSAPRRAWSTILLGVLSLGVAAGAAYVLREVLPRPDYNGAAGIPVNTYPSTHVAIVAAPLVAVVLTIGLRRVAARIYVALILLAMVGNTMRFVHRPNDTVGALLLSVSVTCAMALALDGTIRTRGGSAGRPPV